LARGSSSQHALGSSGRSRQAPGVGSKERQPGRRPSRRPATLQRKPEEHSPGQPTYSSRTRLARRVSWWALLAMVFVVPLATSNLTFLGFDASLTYDQFEIVKAFFLRVLTLVGLGAWGWDILRRGGKVRHAPVDWLVVAFVLWVAITTALSIQWPMALFGKPRRYEGLLAFLNFAVIYFLVLQVVDTAERVRTLARALFFSSVLVSLYGLVQFAGWDPEAWGSLRFEAHRAFSTFGNPEMLGGFLTFSTSIALGLALTERQLAWRLGYWAGFALNGVALIVTFTRGAWIGGAVSIVLLAVAAWRQRAAVRRVDWIPAGISAVLGVGVIARSLSSASEVMNFAERIQSIFQFNAGSGQTRTEIWQAALRAIRERPIQGWGADTFRLVFPRFKPVEYVRDAGGTSVADNAHNYPLQLATGIGILGMLLMYGIFIWAGVRSFSSVFRRNAASSGVLVGAFWPAAAGHLLHLMFGVPVAGNTFLLWIALAIVLGPTGRWVEVRKPKWGFPVAGVVALAALVAVGSQFVPLAADHAYMQAASSSGTGRAEALTRAVRLNPFNGSYKTELAQAYSDEVRGYLDAGAQAKQAGQDTTRLTAAFNRSFRLAKEAFEDAIAFEPDEYDNYVSFGDFYNLGGQHVDKQYYGKAIEVARQGLALEPYGTSIRVVLSFGLLSTGKTQEGIKELEYCMKIDPRSGDAALLLAQAYERDGREADALALLRSVEQLAPGQAGVPEAIKKLESGEVDGQ
jgi:O-antigen ligase